jgi:ubiquinone/menaquinone biosynthesis C-methylase UbiE
MGEPVKLQTGDAYKDEVQNQWDQDPCGSHYVKNIEPDTLEWFLEAERYRYGSYAPWMAEVMEFAGHDGEKILEIGGGMGTDHAQFAKHGGIMHDLDLSSGHLRLAQRNFELRGLSGTFRHGDGETIPFPDNTFDLVYSNGVIHHTPNTAAVVKEIYRVLKPGGRCIIMVYAENSLHYWRNLFTAIGLAQGALESMSMGEIMSRSVEISEHGSKPLVKVYTARRLRKLFKEFQGITVQKRQLIDEEMPRWLKRWMSVETAGRLMGWNLVLKARKPGGWPAHIHGDHEPEAGAAATADPPGSGFERQLVAAKLDFDRWLERRRASRRLYIEEALAHLDALRERQPRIVGAILSAGESYLGHRFDLLGSGAFVPVDPDRPPRDDYVPIDWYLDPVRNLRFPRGIAHKDWKLFEMRPENADIKYPWELARCQHWATLAQAWQLTRDHRFAIEIGRELDDFVEANPVGIGVNWTCTMDIAIRVANWCLALALIHDCEQLDAQFWKRAYNALYDHGEFIFSNLENKYEVTSNHFLSNVVGLHVLAAELGDLDQGKAWDAWCRQALETEIDVQIHPEGADFESSVPYHRLVTELFMASARLARHQGRPLSRNYEDKLARMVAFSLATARPDGLMPVIGDADDGRFHIFTYVEGWIRQDARHLLGPAAALLGRQDWMHHAGPDRAWETAWWGYDPAAAADAESMPPPPLAKLFPDIGIAIARRGGNYLAVTNGVVGTRGFGNHKHNELLGFEYHCGGIPLLVDPGSYVYTSDFSERNRFRSTACHNTLCIDGTEQNEFNPEWIFRLFEKANPEHLEFAVEGNKVTYHGRHRGYERLPEPVVHARKFTFDLATGALEFQDRLEGEGGHQLRWHFHLAPGAEIEGRTANKVRLRAAGRAFTLTLPAGTSAAIGTGWYSPSYGARVEVAVLDASCHAQLAGAQTWTFRIEPAKKAGSKRAARLAEARSA